MPVRTALSPRYLIRPPWLVAATRDENRWARQARLSLVRQSPLLHARFSFQDEVPGSSPGRPTSGMVSGRPADGLFPAFSSNVPLASCRYEPDAPQGPPGRTLRSSDPIRSRHTTADHGELLATVAPELHLHPHTSRSDRRRSSAGGAAAFRVRWGRERSRCSSTSAQVRRERVAPRGPNAAVVVAPRSTPISDARSRRRRAGGRR